MASQPLDPTAENQKLQAFLSSMPSFLEEFADDGEAEGYRFDFSLASVNELERYIRDNQEKLAWKNSSEEAKWERMYVWCYLGETFRKNFGGEWVVSLDDPDSINYGQWVVSGFDQVGVEFDPLGTLQGYLLRGKPALLSVMEAHARPVPLDLSHLEDPEAED